MAQIETQIIPALAVDGRLPTPLYHQIYLVLRNKIVGGELAHGAVLPSEMETARTFGVSRITAKRALNDLAGEGLVKRERGRGTRVTHRASSPPLRADFGGMLENLRVMGRKTGVAVIDFGYEGAGPEVAAALGCAAGDEVQRAVRVRTIDGEPFSHLTTYVPASIGRTFSADELATMPLLGLLERSGVEVARARQTISATLADAGVAPLLGVGPGAPLLRIARIIYDRTDRAVEFIAALYRPDRYQYRMDLSRIGDAGSRAWTPTLEGR